MQHMVQSHLIFVMQEVKIINNHRIFPYLSKAIKNAKIHFERKMWQCHGRTLVFHAFNACGIWTRISLRMREIQRESKQKIENVSHRMVQRKDEEAKHWNIMHNTRNGSAAQAVRVWIAFCWQFHISIVIESAILRAKICCWIAEFAFVLSTRRRRISKLSHFIAVIEIEVIHSTRILRKNHSSIGKSFKIQRPYHKT